MKAVYAFLIVCLLLLIYRFLELTSLFQLINDLPVHSYELVSGERNMMGANTLACFMCLVAALISRVRHNPLLSQVFSFFSLLFPSVSITGYAFHITDFYGEMSLTTTCIAYIMGLSVLGSTANRALLKGLLSIHIGGKLSRIQMVTGFCVCFGIGFLVSRSLINVEAAKSFGLYVNTIAWFLIIMITISSLFYEKVDKKRRQVEKELQQVSSTDPLTGLRNRRDFFSLAKLEKAKHYRMKYDMSVIMIDIDFFKKINDTFGHLGGDRVIQLVANTLTSTVRSSDILCRYGGEEFIALLPGTSLEGAAQLSEKLRTQIEQIDVSSTLHSDNYKLTISAGYSLVSTEDEDITEAIDKADKALYQAKQSGRNKTLPFSPRVVLET
ncbi:GGDEF domain-containing protein [Vibrio nitrifigilis]|uniref:diguanylate cyclase n=1 Tax=Vibrio nitrifigilis TaxID=2789781 RepID=A0ABS0GJ10_9VIBR|nr:GGDEF domain-containing protein [Vibrio nitrifigilis]MBF9002432.1 GGDEF domain-containing protein [Vibrio nitrifigilis]